MLGSVWRSFLFFGFVSATHDEQRPRPETGIVTMARETKRPENTPQQKTGTHPKHTTGAPAVPQTRSILQTALCRGPEPVRHGIPKLGRFGRKTDQSSAKCHLRSDVHRQAPPTLDIGGLRRMQTARGLTLCLSNQDFIATTDRLARSAWCIYDGRQRSARAPFIVFLNMSAQMKVAARAAYDHF